jgi:hypothetical protein
MNALRAGAARWYVMAMFRATQIADLLRDVSMP